MNVDCDYKVPMHMLTTLHLTNWFNDKVPIVWLIKFNKAVSPLRLSQRIRQSIASPFSADINAIQKRYRSDAITIAKEQD